MTGMLNIIYGDCDNAIYNPNVYFNNSYIDEWMSDDLNKKMIKDIDNSEVIDTYLINSPVLGGISPERLSGGVKTLICIHMEPEKIFNVSTCGDNCSKWLLELSKDRDLTVNLRHLMDFGDNSFEIYIKNTDSIVHNMDELVSVAGELL